MANVIKCKTVHRADKLTTDSGGMVTVAGANEPATHETRNIR